MITSIVVAVLGAAPLAVAQWLGRRERTVVVLVLVKTAHRAEP